MRNGLLFREKEAKSFCRCRVEYLVWLGLVLPLVARGQTAKSPDKSGYTLFDPTPDALLRDFSTDRPGKTSNPVTLDAGHMQIESDILNFAYDHWSNGAITTQTTVYGGPELKVGVTNWAEIAAVLPLYTVMRQTDRQTHTHTTASGLGDLLLGGKVNFFGNEGGNALAALLFVKVPTAARGLGNNMVEGTLAVPLATSLPAGFSLTVEPVFGLAREANAQGYAGDYQLLVNLGHTLWTKTVTGAIEFAADYSTDPNTGTRDTVDLTLQWQVAKTWQLDGAVYFGVDKAANDINPYVGISHRF